jgi:hypothetical protein
VTLGATIETRSGVLLRLPANDVAMPGSVTALSSDLVDKRRAGRINGALAVTPAFQLHQRSTPAAQCGCDPAANCLRCPPERIGIEVGIPLRR